MIELTGENLSTYLLREIKDIVNRNPRFRRLGGDVTVSTNNMVAWGDLRITISRINSSGNRLSPDYFICNQYGRALLAKLENYDGLFIEWVQEIRDNGSTLPASGVYYFNIDAVNEGTRDILLTIQNYQWIRQTPELASGSLVYFNSNIDVSTVTPIDSTVQYVYQGNNLVLTNFYPNFLELQATNSSGISTPLIPMTDFWYLRQNSDIICQSTLGGEQIIALPISNWVSMSISDQDGYVLRENIDYIIFGSSIQTSQWTPSGTTLTCSFVAPVSPTTNLAVNPENLIAPNLPPDETPTQTIVYSSLLNRSAASDFIVLPNGETWLSTLLVTGERFYWESRVDLGQTQHRARKMESNLNLIPGLSIAIGDQVFVGDQCAILVSPYQSEVYEVYGSKDNLTFTIEVKANDRMTASEVSEMIKGAFLIRDRAIMEANGLTVFEISREANYDSRDDSGTAPSTTYTMSVSAAADWELYIPLVTRISQFEVDVTETTQSDFLGKITTTPRFKTLGATQFLPNYS